MTKTMTEPAAPVESRSRWLRRNLALALTDLGDLLLVTATWALLIVTSGWLAAPGRLPHRVADPVTDLAVFAAAYVVSRLLELAGWALVPPADGWLAVARREALALAFAALVALLGAGVIR